jgi:hypothetical protein
MDHHHDEDEDDEEKRSEALILADIQTLACRVGKKGGRGGREGGWERRRRGSCTCESMHPLTNKRSSFSIYFYHHTYRSLWAPSCGRNARSCGTAWRSEHRGKETQRGGGREGGSERDSYRTHVCIFLSSKT